MGEAGHEPLVDERSTSMLHRLVPLSAELGMDVLHHSAQEVRVRLAHRPQLCTSGGVLHGGTIMALADTSGAACALANLPEGAEATTTIESKTNFLHAITSGHATAVSRPLHAGRRVIVVDTEVFDDGGRLVARVTQTQAVL